ncbi:MAG TPA: glycosyltransferase family 4 protein, partial [Thermoleophilaceae bacterium]|nr:glycosyltransferase family 4 protein [Thermoleophilaceae bacterium]
GFLSKHADVTVLTSSRWRDQHDELARSGDERLPAGVRFAFVDEPEGDLSPFLSWNQAWSVRLLEGVAELHPDGGPDILEMGDYQAEGFAAAHARRGQDPRLRNTALVIRLHTSAEMCAGLNDAPDDLHLKVLGGLERFPLRFADAILEPGGNSLERYGDFYGAGSLAPALKSPLPMTTDLSPPADARSPSADGPVRLLYLNRLERRKGIAELISAVRSLPDAELALTIIGGDTSSGPDGTSMRAHAEELAAGDARIEFVDRIPHEEVPRAIAEHHVVVVPTRWETFSYVVREALACNRPVLATPAGGIVDVVRHGESGWLAESGSPEDLAATLSELLADRDRVTEMIAEGLPRAAFDRDAQEEPLQAYLEVLERRADAAPTDTGEPAAASVTALVACEAGGGDAYPTLASLEAQSGPAVRAVLVVGASGAFPGPGLALAHAHAVVATPGGGWGERVAWAEGLAHATGELVLLMPAGAVLEDQFLPRAAAVLAAEPELAWVTAFAVTGDTPAHAPPGSYMLPLAEMDASPSVALVRRTALEAATRDEDAVRDGHANVFVQLARAGAHGVVLQEPLVASLPRRATQRALAQR